ncbi:hypothetical protein EOL99_02210, partial [Candidatus Falkowbacteria bacterium]|nr:hypothetical protein [Candidatus Falkowbacteria bacterium]
NIATASILTERVKGMTIEQAKKYAWQEIVNDLGGLPKQKIHCSVMAVQGLKKAILDYEEKQKVTSSAIRSKKTKVVKKKPSRTKKTNTKK